MSATDKAVVDLFSSCASFTMSYPLLSEIGLRRCRNTAYQPGLQSNSKISESNILAKGALGSRFTIYFTRHTLKGSCLQSLNATKQRLSHDVGLLARSTLYRLRKVS